MPERAEAVLRVEPHQIPALLVAFTDARSDVDQRVRDLRSDGQIREPWMGDPISSKVKKAYDDHAMYGANSTLTHLDMYRDELTGVIENLMRMEEGYRRTEGDNAALWGSRA